MFSHFNTDVTISRQVRTGTKTAYQTIGGTVSGHLKPLADEQQSIGLNNMANMFSFTTTAIEDIRESDRLTIGSVVYGVRGVNTHAGIRVSYMRCILVKEELGR